MSIIALLWTSKLVNTFFRQSFCLEPAFNAYTMGSSFIAIPNFHPKTLSAPGVDSAKGKTQ
jgi:hypothetical protein